MTADQKTARLVGAFYIAATVAGLIGLSLTQNTLDASDYLSEVAANDTRMAAGTLFELIMAVAVTCIAIAVYPVLKKYDVRFAVSYMAARLVEGVLFIIDAISILTLLTLSREFVDAGGPADPYYETLGELLLAVREWSGHVILDVAVFPLGALVLYTVLYRARLVPRWLSGVGLIGAVLYWVAGVLVMLDALEPLTDAHIMLQAPLGLQEMVLAVWLLVRGFSPSAIATEPAGSP